MTRLPPSREISPPLAAARSTPAMHPPTFGPSWHASRSPSRRSPARFPARRCAVGGRSLWAVEPSPKAGRRGDVDHAGRTSGAVRRRMSSAAEVARRGDGQTIRTRLPDGPRSTTTSSTRPVTTARPSPGSGSGVSAGPWSSTCTEKPPARRRTPPRWGRSGPGRGGCATARAQVSPTARRTSSSTSSSRPERRASVAATSRAVRTCAVNGGEPELDGAHASDSPRARPRRPWRGSGTPWSGR